MKRVGFLWEDMISVENLYRASRAARRGKRYRPACSRFEYQLEKELFSLHEELATGTYKPGPYRSFEIYEPKKRLISAAFYRDRVVQHALTNCLSKVFEPRFIANSFACRQGKGTHAAVARAQAFSKKHRYVWKADVAGFFPSMDHQVLVSLIQRKIKDNRVVWLSERILQESPAVHRGICFFPGDDLFTVSERRCGLPIGNQTSQFFANVYLDPLDHFVTDCLGIASYVRYVDDFLVFADSLAQLHEIRKLFARKLSELRLDLHKRKNTFLRVTDGVRFLGFRVFPTHVWVSNENVKRFLRRCKVLQEEFRSGRISPSNLQQRIAAWVGHVGQGDTYRLREGLFDKIGFQRWTSDPTSDSGRVVQQSIVERPLFGPEQQ